MYSPPIIKASHPIDVKIPNKGTLTGLSILDPNTNIPKCTRFAGIRFAQPPIGELRWKLPQPLPKDYDYQGDYTKFRSVCPQPIYNNRPNQPPNTTDTYDEDCLFINIWVPASEPPKEGWPVLYFIHGGWLQVGTPSTSRWSDPQDLLSDSSPSKCIMVSAAYRLNLFGFLAGKQLLEEDNKSSNFGFWDQRLGLEWVYKNIKDFGGDIQNITVGGVSAGSYSSIFQLAYEMYHPEELQIIKKVQLISNGLGLQPKDVEESQEQFELLAEAFNISRDLSGKEKLEKMRSIPFKELASKIMSLELHTFRASTDNQFVSPTLFHDIWSGKFGQLVNKSKIDIIIGEVINEYSIYANTNPPKTSIDFKNQLHNYYPSKLVKSLLEIYPPLPDKNLEKSNPEKYKQELKELFGIIVSDMQVYVSSRLLVTGLYKGGVPLNKIHRYRMAYRAKFFDEYESPSQKVPHAGDVPIWLYNFTLGVLEEEKPFYFNWMKPVGDWFYGRDVNWGTKDIKELRYFHPDGSITIEEDDKWEWALKVENVIANL